MTMGVAGGMAGGGFLLGLLVGARFRISAAMKAMLEKMKKDKADAGDEGENEEQEEEDEGKLKDLIDQLLDQYLSRDWVGGLDDHPETTFNPIMMYQVKKSKEELRRKKELEAKLIAAGYEANHLDTLDPEARAKLIEELQETKVVMGGNVGSVAGKVRRYGSTVNSTRILVQQGARFMPGAMTVLGDSDSQEAKLAQEVRERMRVIDSHLQNKDGIDTTKTEVRHKARAGQSGLVKNALEMAKETKYKPFGGAAIRRAEEMGTYASRGRSRVGPPLDHAIAASNEKTRRASCGAARRASVSGGGRRPSVAGGGRPPASPKGDGGKATAAAEEKVKNASNLLGKLEA